MEQEIVFRIAEDNDLSQIVELTNECFDDFTEIEKAREIFAKRTEELIYLVGEMDGKIVAQVMISIVPTIWEPMGKFALLNHVCVKPEYRRHHLGWRLLEEAEKICREKGVIKMELWSKNFRVPAHELYKKYGFMIEDAKFFTKEI